MHMPTLAWIFVKLPLTIKWKQLFSHLVGTRWGSPRAFPGPWNLACPQGLANPDCDWVRAGEVVLRTLWTCKGCLWNPPDTLRTVLSLKQHQSKGTEAVSMPWGLCHQATQNQAAVIVTNAIWWKGKGLWLFVSFWFHMLGIQQWVFLIFDQNIALY